MLIISNREIIEYKLLVFIDVILQNKGVASTNIAHLQCKMQDKKHKLHKCINTTGNRYKKKTKNKEKRN